MQLHRCQEAFLLDCRGNGGELRQHGVDFVLERVCLRAGVAELQRAGLSLHAFRQQRLQRLRAIKGPIALAAHIIVVCRARADGQASFGPAVVAGHRRVAQAEVAAKAAGNVVCVRIDVRPFAVEAGEVPRAALRGDDLAFQPCGAHQRVEGQRITRRIGASQCERPIGGIARARSYVGNQPVVEPQCAFKVILQPLPIQSGDPLIDGLAQLLRKDCFLRCGRGIRFALRIVGDFAGFFNRRVAGFRSVCFIGGLCRSVAGFRSRILFGFFGRISAGFRFGILGGRLCRGFRLRFHLNLRLRLDFDDLRRCALHRCFF